MEETVAALREALSSSVVTPRLALEGEPPAPDVPLCARVAGFTLHAAQAVCADDRASLERLCKYGLRSPFSQERLSRADDGRVVYTLRRPWPRRGGVTSIALEPEAFLRRLAALTPAPYAHLVRYHGVFANRARARRRLPAPPAAVVDDTGATDSSVDTPARRSRRPLPWAQLLMRVFAIDALRCPRCAQPMIVLALINDPPVVAKILSHLGLLAAPLVITPAHSVGAGDREFGDAPFLDLDQPTGEVEDADHSWPDDLPDAPRDDDDAPP